MRRDRRISYTFSDVRVPSIGTETIYRVKKSAKSKQLA
jgi:hypothetical protein